MKSAGAADQGFDSVPVVQTIPGGQVGKPPPPPPIGTEKEMLWQVDAPV
jgi:hypothetical protein